MDDSRFNALRNEYAPSVDYGSKANAVEDYLLTRKLIRSKKAWLEKNVRWNLVDIHLNRYEKKISSMSNNELKKEWESLSNKQ